MIFRGKNQSKDIRDQNKKNQIWAAITNSVTVVIIRDSLPTESVKVFYNCVKDYQYFTIVIDKQLLLTKGLEQRIRPVLNCMKSGRIIVIENNIAIYCSFLEFLLFCNTITVALNFWKYFFLLIMDCNRLLSVYFNIF